MTVVNSFNILCRMTSGRNPKTKSIDYIPRYKAQSEHYVYVQLGTVALPANIFAGKRVRFKVEIVSETKGEPDEHQQP